MSGYLVYLAAENTLFPVAFGIILYQWALIMQCKNRVINTLPLSTLDDSVRMMLWGTGLSANYSPAISAAECCTVTVQEQQQQQPLKKFYNIGCPANNYLANPEAGQDKAILNTSNKKKRLKYNYK